MGLRREDAARAAGGASAATRAMPMAGAEQVFIGGALRNAPHDAPRQFGPARRAGVKGAHMDDSVAAAHKDTPLLVADEG